MNWEGSSALPRNTIRPSPKRLDGLQNLEGRLQPLASTGTQLIQELIRENIYGIKRYDLSMDKIMRLHSITDMIENGFVYLPTEATWLGGGERCNARV